MTNKVADALSRCDDNGPEEVSELHALQSSTSGILSRIRQEITPTRDLENSEIESFMGKNQNYGKRMMVLYFVKELFIWTPVQIWLEK